MENTYLMVSDFAKYMHYRDRQAPWVRIHCALLDDYQFCSMPDSARYHAVAIVLLASRMENKIPMNAQWIGQRIASSSPVDLDALFRSGFLLPWAPPENSDPKWASRSVNREVKDRVLTKSGGVCAACGAAESLEIDHILPISRGGTSDEANLQVLCRSCNRRKRTKQVDFAAAKEATQGA